MIVKRRLALVSIADANRAALATYLKGAGFDVHECVELEIPSSFGALVLLGDETSDKHIRARVRSWMKLTKNQRVVVVTSKPSVLRELVAAHNERLFVLPAPVFGWDIVDRLRANLGTRP